MIVFFIIGHNRNQAQSTPEEYGIPVIPGRQNHIFFKNGNRELVHLLNGWQTGKRKPKACILPAEWKAMSLDIPIGRTFNETMLVDDCKSKTRRTTGLQSVSRIDVVHSIRFRLVLTDAEPMLALVVDHEARMCRSPG